MSPSKGQKAGDASTTSLDVLQRLASGQKTVVDVKEMKKLTVKNYEKLPEI